MDLATQSGWDWDHEDARKKLRKAICVCRVIVLLKVFIFGEFTSNTGTQITLVHVQSPSLAPKHLLTLSDLVVISLLRQLSHYQQCYHVGC